MKHSLILFTLLFTIQSFPMESSNNTIPLTFEEAIGLAKKEADLLKPANTPNASHTPILDKYKCCFILGRLKPKGIAKLKRKIPQHIGALLAQKKYMGHKLTLSEELAVWRWSAELAARHSLKKSP
ncbi:hypothetical protein BH09DEP1_BH09DEP1_1100 [soil metagenome]